jgi:hypothetical protein
MTTDNGSSSSTDGGAPPAAAAAPAASETPVAAAPAAEPEKKTPLADAQEAAAAERAGAAKKEEDDARQAAFEKEKGAELAQQEKDRRAAESGPPVEVTLPEHLPQSMRGDDTVEIVQEMTGTISHKYAAPQVQRLVDIGAEIAMEVKDVQPDLNNQDAVLGVLRQRWGSTYDANLAGAKQAAQGLGERFLDWCDKTGGGNRIEVLECLAALQRGDFSLGKEAAKKELAEMRKPGSPLMNNGHKDHQYALTRSRILTEAINHGDDPRAMEKAVQKTFAAAVGAASRGETFTPAAPKAKTGDEARITEIRANPAYRKGDKALVAEMNAINARLYPGDQS